MPPDLPNLQIEVGKLFYDIGSKISLLDRIAEFPHQSRCLGGKSIAKRQSPVIAARRRFSTTNRNIVIPTLLLPVTDYWIDLEIGVCFTILISLAPWRKFLDLSSTPILCWHSDMLPVDKWIPGGLIFFSFSREETNFFDISSTLRERNAGTASYLWGGFNCWLLSDITAISCVYSNGRAYRNLLGNEVVQDNHW